VSCGECGRNAIVGANSTSRRWGGGRVRLEPPGICYVPTSVASMAAIKQNRWGRSSRCWGADRPAHRRSFRRAWAARDCERLSKIWATLDPDRLPKAIFPVLPKLRELVPYLSVGALYGDADRNRILRGAHDVSAIGRFRSVVTVTGLAFEARIAGGVTVISDGVRTGATLKAEIERGSRGVISFGIAGGLAPHLAPGQWVVASAIVSDRDRHVTDPDWSERLLRALPGAVHAMIAGNDAPVADPRAKRALYDRTGAIVVDMESHLAARIAAAHGLPFTACRVIVDPAHRNLPPAALLGLRPDGNPDVAAVLRSVMEQPSQLPDLMRLAFDATIARAALRRGRALLGPALGFPDLGDLEVDLAPAPALS
jgi:adenosylhomocysteine nucleosidase